MVACQRQRSPRWNGSGLPVGSCCWSAGASWRIDLQRVFDRLELFDRVVLENGALLYRPASREEHPLAEAAPARFVDELRTRDVSPLSVGRTIVATWHPHENTVTAVIRDLGLELQVIFNKGAVMILPSGVNKATGLVAALNELGLSAHNVVGVGDAENDHAFLSACECAVAVANALPALAERCDLVTTADHGAGVVELADQLVADDLAQLAPRLLRHAIELGNASNGSPITVAPFGPTLLIAGTSGGGKSTLAAGVLERAAEHGYQFCIIDPEGDYEQFAGAIKLGDGQRVPGVDEVLGVLADPHDHLVVNLLGLPLQDRPAYFQMLLARIQDLRARTGRPHWLLVDEAHHLVPSVRADDVLRTFGIPPGLILLTVHPSRLAPAVLETVGTAVVVGDAAETVLAELAQALGQAAPNLPREQGVADAVVWRTRSHTTPQAHRAPQYGRAAPAPAQVCPRRAGRGQELLVHRSGRHAAPACPESHALPADRRWRGRRDVAASPARRRLLPLASRSDQGHRTRRRRRGGRSRYWPVAERQPRTYPVGGRGPLPLPA